MSRTHKDMSASAFKRKHGIENWWDHPDVIGRGYRVQNSPGYRPPTTKKESRNRKVRLRKYWGGVRNRVRMDLLAGHEPEPTRTRHRVLWDLS